MSDNRAYAYYIGPDPAYGESAGLEDGLVNQSSPSWVLTFVRWRYRDTLRTNNIAASDINSPTVLDMLKKVEETLVVRSDCVSVSTMSNKGTFTASMEAVLLPTNVDYLTEIAPGDFVFVNMLNWESDAEDVASRADVGQKAINNIDDGFKGFFKVQSVRETLAVTNPQTGAKTRVIRISGYAFTEFNNMIYFNQAVALKNPGYLVFAGQILNTWRRLTALQEPFSLRNLIMELTSAFIGSGLPDHDSANPLGTMATPNGTFFMPAVVGNLLGNQNVKTAADTYNFLFGLQQYSRTNSNLDSYLGLNPTGLVQQTIVANHSAGVKTRFWFTPVDCSGTSTLKPDYWDQTKVWDILSQYVNKPVNEFFTCFRVAPNANRVMPTVIFRQIPFTTEDFVMAKQGSTNSSSVTRFFTLPRWQIDPSIVVSQDIGRDEAARINYVQIFGKTGLSSEGTDYAAETVLNNYVQDVNDIQRSGLRPCVIGGLFDLVPEKSGTVYNSPFWAKLVGDALIGGHLKFSGTITCLGIVDPIAVGDNLEYDGVVYHIEQITHKAEINVGSGIKTFRTAISVSQGLSIRSNSSKSGGTIYPGMDYSNAYKEREIDYQNAQILPGVSESQHVPARDPGVDQKAPLDQPNKQFPQPSQIKFTKTAQPKPTRKK
jgi:hypothetical protein